MKVQLSVTCDSCKCPHCIYSTNIVVINNGSSQIQITNRGSSSDNGDVCGHKFDTNNIFYTRHHLQGGDNAESQYCRIGTTDC